MFLGIFSATPASAAIVFTQEPTESFAGTAINRSDGQNFLNQFSLGAATNLNGFDLLSSLTGIQVGQNVTIKIRNSVSGAPAIMNLFSFASTINSTSGGFLQADFSNIFLGAGTYFIGMSGTAANIGQDIFRDSSIPAKAYQLNGDNIQYASGFVSGFKVHGDVAVAAVPEPATWAMMLLGFGVIGSAMRRGMGKPGERFTRKARAKATA
ncbi:PEPxxWA-CTERM sorting domain-containing protein [Sphingomonas sp. M1-B02]|uniref:PEPxxWA-CTERM sorting domain-containing protein n=1 Tax=Sphingomonas sp. M1-B02 TaxID=3114300 RepID=UPI00224085D4|nr:PEPxxWA-CTERM sorting domain-containing protein [Sphingomonas sp. S6-11]UZK67782.1 PEPxxWA-CTERM sorting domain-containing protein [Sphingomonas sp. S6-11]